MDIGAKIKRIRLSNQLTLEELANRSELTKGFLSQLERDLTSPSVATLENLLEEPILKTFFRKMKMNKSFLVKKIFLKIFKMIIRSHILFQMLKKMKWNPF